MAFEFGTWLLTFTFNRIGNKSLDWAAKSALSSGLTGEINEWAAALPSDINLVPEAMFPKVAKAETEEKRPALAKLSLNLKEKSVPTDAIWLDALIEQWTAVGQSMPKTDLQAFFTLPPDTARGQLKTLSVALSRRCAQVPVRQAPVALPVLVDLYRTPEVSTAKSVRHRSPARLMCRLLRRFPDRTFIFAGDAGFGTNEVARFCHRHRTRVTLLSKCHPLRRWTTCWRGRSGDDATNTGRWRATTGNGRSNHPAGNYGYMTRKTLFSSLYVKVRSRLVCFHKRDKTAFLNEDWIEQRGVPCDQGAAAVRDFGLHCTGVVIGFVYFKEHKP
jgi:hypothetical protein